MITIDGVLLRGSRVIPQARSALEKLRKRFQRKVFIEHHIIFRNIPFIFLTNGGGMLENEKAEDLEKKLEIKVLII
jgi:ribonucleotide monophosphatase NagD (HAD superfamily)